MKSPPTLKLIMEDKSFKRVTFNDETSCIFKYHEMRSSLLWKTIFENRQNNLQASHLSDLSSSEGKVHGSIYRLKWTQMDYIAHNDHLILWPMYCVATSGLFMKW